MAVEQVEGSAIAGCPGVSLSDPQEARVPGPKRDLFGNPTGPSGPEMGTWQKNCTDGGGSLAPGWASARELPSLPFQAGEENEAGLPSQLHFCIFFSRRERKRPTS